MDFIIIHLFYPFLLLSFSQHSLLILNCCNRLPVCLSKTPFRKPPYTPIIGAPLPSFPSKRHRKVPWRLLFSLLRKLTEQIPAPIQFAVPQYLHPQPPVFVLLPPLLLHRIQQHLIGLFLLGVIGIAKAGENFKQCLKYCC